MKEGPVGTDRALSLLPAGDQAAVFPLTPPGPRQPRSWAPRELVLPPQDEGLQSAYE